MQVMAKYYYQSHGNLLKEWEEEGGNSDQPTSLDTNQQQILNECTCLVLLNLEEGEAAVIHQTEVVVEKERKEAGL